MDSIKNYRFGFCLLAVCLCTLFMFIFTGSVFANSLEDNIGSPSGKTGQSSSQFGENYDDNAYKDYDNGVSDLLKNQEPVTEENIAQASDMLSPLTNLIGNIIGGLMVLASVGIFLITAIDLLYLAVPPLRPLFASPDMDGAGGMTGGRTGMGYGGGGYGGGGYGGGYGRGGMMGGNQGGARKRQWVSDEALACASLIGGSAQSAGMNAPGMGYGGASMAQGQEAQRSTSSVFVMYFKKRVVVLIFFAICSVMLTSSLFIGVGINIAAWATNMVSMLSNSIPGIGL